MQKKLSFCDLVLDLKWGQGQNERYVAHLQWLYNWLAPSMCKYVKRFGLSRAHKVPPILNKVCRKTKFFATLSWIWNKVKVKMKSMLHIYNDCTIDWHQVCENMWSGLGWVAHTKYHPSYIKYAWKQSFSWPCPGSEIKSMSKWKVCCTSTMIVQLIGTKYVKICEVVWAESRTQSTTHLI